MAWKTLDDLDLGGKKVLVRVDINVPIENGAITDATRIEKIVPTIADILVKGGKPIVLAHFDRPKGKVVPEMSLGQLLGALTNALGVKVIFAADSIGPVAQAAAQSLKSGEVLLLENTRFHKGEEKHDPAFAAELALLGDIYVNDAFSAAHRAHASTEAIAKLLPNAAGRLMATELEALDLVLGAPIRPVVAVVGGAKVSTKLDLLSNLVRRVDHLVIGGGMANTFLAAQGIEVGTSLAEHYMTKTANTILAKAKAAACTIHLPLDIVVATAFKAGAEHRILPVTNCPSDAMILDAGPQTVVELIKLFEKAKTLIWNGPLGAFEIAPFDMATNDAAAAVAKLTRAGSLVSVAGGGDTVAALKKAKASTDFTYISTAGGAFLDWMEGKTLPGVAALMSKCL
jgi:phosphoglycerate kinase